MVASVLNPPVAETAIAHFVSIADTRYIRNLSFVGPSAYERCRLVEEFATPLEYATLIVVNIVVYRVLESSA